MSIYPVTGKLVNLEEATRINMQEQFFYPSSASTEELKSYYAERQEWAESGQKKKRNVPPRPKQKRKRKGPKTHRS